MRMVVNSTAKTIWAVIGPLLMFLVLGAVYVIGMSILMLSDMLRPASRQTASGWLPATADSPSRFARWGTSSWPAELPGAINRSTSAV